jgi:SNF2 family DNA or RNA helicase
MLFGIDMLTEPKIVVKNSNHLIYITNPTIIIKLCRGSSDKNVCELNYYISNKALQRIINGKREIRGKKILEIASAKVKTNIVNNMKLELQNLRVPVSYTNNNLNINGILKPNELLYNYQINDILWIEKLEKTVRNGSNHITYDYKVAAPIIDSRLYLFKGELHSFPGIENITCTASIVYQGGNLISDVGLGKTVIALYSIFKSGLDNRHLYDKYVDFGKMCNYVYKRGINRGKSCTGTPIDLYCKEHTKSAFVEKRVLEYKNLDQFDISQFFVQTNNSLSIHTNASLVICPSHLCNQWSQEYYKRFVNDKRVVLILNKDQFINVTVGDLLFADVVITSYQFLLNPYYQSQLRCHQQNVDEQDKLKLLNSKTLTMLHLYKWNKLFLDEAHEIQNTSNSSLLVEMIKMISSTYKWNITGTPFANGVDSFLHLLHYNTSFNPNVYSLHVKNMYASDFLTYGINDVLVNSCPSLFRYNSKNSVEHEINKNIVHEHIRYLDFTAQERSIYDSYLQGNRNKYANFLIQLCCHSELHYDTKKLLHNCKSLDEIQEAIFKLNEKRLKETKRAITDVEVEIESIIEDDVTDPVLQQLQKTHLTSLKRRLVALKQSYQSIDRTYSYLKTAIANVNETDTCPICLDDIEKVTITKCGHKFCWECLIETYEAQSHSIFKCPTCNTQLHSNEIYQLDETDKQKISSLDTIIHAVKSTKIGNIIFFLQSEIGPEDKVIIFSQWDELLHKVGKYLQDYDLNIVYCNGSIYQRKNAITSFCKDPKTNVIMLSSRNAASGINLTAANKIVLIEPVYGTKEYRENIETQIIGRSNRIGQTRPIDVFKFIIKDTIEDDIINDRIEESKLRQMTI